MKKSNFTFTITATDRCNAACTYCHYYSAGGKAAKRAGGTKRSLFRSDIDDETLNAYFQFISYFKKKFPNQEIFASVYAFKLEAIKFYESLFELSSLVFMRKKTVPEFINCIWKAYA